MKLFRAAKDLVAKQLDPAPGDHQHHQQHAHQQQHAQQHWPRHEHDPVLEHLLRDFRSPHLRKLLFAHEAAEYTDVLDVRLLAGTYNVAGKKPPPGLKLHDWLDQWKHSWPGASADNAAAAAEGPDIIAIGFQEVVPLSAGNVIAGPSSDGADAWDHALAATLNGDAWASKHAGRMFGSSVASQAAYSNLGAKAAAAAYSIVATQAATLVGAMDRTWAGGNGQDGGEGAAAAAAAAGDSAAQQQQRLAFVLSCSEDGEDVYVQVACKQLVGLYLTVWARKRLARSVRGVQAAAAATGWGGYLGNKGGVAVRLRVHDAGLVLVCTHLASGDAEGDEQRRNADVREILRRCVFDGPDGQAGDGGAGRQQQGSSSSSGHWGGASAILDHGNVVWLGDLNYRLTCSDEEGRKLLRAGRLEALQAYDQLSCEMRAGRVFQGWQEGPLSFAPTYKYLLGCNVYSGDPLPAGIAAVKAVDSYASLTDSEATGGEGGGDGSGSGPPGRESPSVEKQKKRTPAWCDRVLWLPGRQLYQLAYGRGELAVSDHRPVAAAFLMQAHRYKRDAVQALAEDARRAVDASSNAARPRCSLEPRFIELGPLPFGAPKAYTLTLTNTGPVTARFYWVAPPKPRQGSGGAMEWDDNQPLCPPWLAVSAEEGEVQPGGSATITLTALITGGGPGSAAAFLAAHPPPPPARPDTLDAILILRLEDGADSFVSVRGAALPSCFGMDLDALLTLGDGAVLPGAALEGGEVQALLQAGLQQQGVDMAGQLSATVGDLGLGPEFAEPQAGSDAAAAAADGDAVGRSASALQRREASSGVEARVPKEVQRLVHFLEEPHRLRTPGLFVHSCQACLDATSSSGGSSSGVVGSSPGATQQQQQHVQQLLAATTPVRWALDAGVDLPAHVTPHAAAAALLLLVQQLPEPLMPPDVSAILLHCVPGGPACTSLLSDAMSVAEWATLRMMLRLWRAALEPEAAAANGLTLPSLAGVLAEHCFGPGALAAPPALVANRIAFMMTLLDPHGRTSSSGGGGGGSSHEEPAAAAAGRKGQPPVAGSSQAAGRNCGTGRRRA